MRVPLLEGVRVIEVGAMWAAPYAARILADLGAEVIKVEGPRKPEQVRFGFYPGNDPGERPWERGGHFQKFGRNKKSVILDLTMARGRELLLALLRTSDVLIENNTPRVREHLGLGNAFLARETPDLVVVSMPGFGDDGPYHNYLAFGLNIEGFAGLTAVTGYPDDTPPIRSAIPYGDPVAAVYGAIAAVLGLRARRRGGQGTRFELSQHEGLLSLLPDVLLEAQVTGRPPARRGNADPLLAVLQGVFAAGPGEWLALTVPDEVGLQALAALTGSAGLAAADGQATPTARRAIEGWTASLGAEEAARRLRGAGLAAAPVLTPGGMMRHEQVTSRTVYEPVDHPAAGTLPYSRLPLRFHGEAELPDRHAPLFGEHNRYVFGDLLGLSEAEITALYAEGITSDAPELALPAAPRKP